jgi:hypothetical protein
VSLGGLDAPWGDAGAVQGALCHGGVREGWGPPLPPGDLGLGDQLSAPTGAGVEARRAPRGARRLRWSPSAPACNPMEPGGSQRKTSGRRAKARTVAALLAALKEALETITVAAMRGRLEYGGSPVH